MFVCFVCDSLCDVVCGVCLCVFVIARAPLFNVFAHCCMLVVCICCVLECDCVLCAINCAVLYGLGFC